MKRSLLIYILLHISINSKAKNTDSVFLTKKDYAVIMDSLKTHNNQFTIPHKVIKRGTFALYVGMGVIFLYLILKIFVMDKKEILKIEKKLVDKIKLLETEIGLILHRLNDIEIKYRSLNSMSQNPNPNENIENSLMVAKQESINIIEFTPVVKVQNKADIYFFKSYNPDFGWSQESSLNINHNEAYIKVYKDKDQYKFEVNNHSSPIENCIKDVELYLGECCEIKSYNRNLIININNIKPGELNLTEGVFKLKSKALVQPI